MKKKKFFILGTAIIIVAALISYYMINAKAQPGKRKKAQTTLNVKTEKVNYANHPAVMNYKGRISSLNNITVSSEVTGKILKGDVDLKPGTTFKKGDILFKIYSKDTEAKLISDKCAYLETLSNALPDIKIDFPAEYAKWNDFFNSIDLKRKLPKLPEATTNKEKIFLASNNVLTGYYNIIEKEITLSKYTVTAPFNGSIISASKEVGDIAGQNSTIAEIIRAGQMEITVPVKPSDVKWIKKGNDATIIGRNGEKTTGKIVRISKAVDEMTQSVNIYLNIKNAESKEFLQGEYADVQFKGKGAYGMIIPREALIKPNKVYEIANGKLHATEVKVVRELEDYFIISGPDTTKEIITESLTDINPNTKYIPRK